MLIVNKLSMAFGARLLFDDVSFNLNEGSRYGLVGANGAGKSTFLALLSGTEEPSLGEVIRQNNATVSWLKQDQFTYEGDSIINAVIRGKPELFAAIVEKEALLEADVWNDETGMRLGELEETIMLYDGYTASDFASRLLMGLGIPEKSHHHPLKTLSGGYKLRVLLAQALFNEPDVLLLDEPTNHLDLGSIAWLENYLIEEFKGVLVFISHDQDFLQNLATHILDIDYGDIACYKASYQKFLKLKSEAEEQILFERKNLEQRIQKLQSFADRFRAKPSKARQVKSKEKMIDRIEIPEIKKSTRVAPALNFQQKRASGKDVLKVKDISKAYGDKKVLNSASFLLRRGEKVALIGPNGVGKSTLLKIITDHLLPDQGSLDWGHGVSFSYFAQDHHESLKGREKVYNWIEHQCPQMSTTALRATLGAVLFSQDDIEKSIATLSGGEAARLVLAKVMLEEANLLILDEPTNHMDIEAVNALIKALKVYPGTVLFVSHNRHFVERLATRIIALTPKGLKDNLGSYQDYLKQEGIDYLKAHSDM